MFGTRLGLALHTLTCLVSCSNVPRANLPPSVEPFAKSHADPPALTWLSADGTTRLPYAASLPASTPPKAIVILTLGWDTVTGDYASLYQELPRHGYAVYGTENRSFHYGPPQLQGDSDGWRNWVADVKAFSRFVREKHPGVPVVWHGLSLGALQVMLAAWEVRGTGEEPAGLIVHSPAYAMMPAGPIPVRRLLYGSFQWVRFPQLKMMCERDLHLTTDDLWNGRWLLSEDRVRQGYKVRFLVQAVEMGMLARKNSRGLTLPVLAMWGGKDRLTLKGDASERPAYDRFMREELAGGKATHIYFEHGGHVLTEGEFSNHGVKPKALAVVVEWLNNL